MPEFSVTAHLASCTGCATCLCTYGEDDFCTMMQALRRSDDKDKRVAAEMIEQLMDTGTAAFARGHELATRENAFTNVRLQAAIGAAYESLSEPVKRHFDWSVYEDDLAAFALALLQQLGFKANDGTERCPPSG